MNGCRQAYSHCACSRHNNPSQARNSMAGRASGCGGTTAPHAVPTLPFRRAHTSACEPRSAAGDGASIGAKCGNCNAGGNKGMGRPCLAPRLRRRLPEACASAARAAAAALTVASTTAARAASASIPPVPERIVFFGPVTTDLDAVAAPWSRLRSWPRLRRAVLMWAATSSPR